MDWWNGWPASARAKATKAEWATPEDKNPALSQQPGKRWETLVVPSHENGPANGLVVVDGWLPQPIGRRCKPNPYGVKQLDTLIAVVLQTTTP